MKGCMPGYMTPNSKSDKMLKKSASFVLASKASSTYPRGYASGAFFGCGRADGLFEHLALVVASSLKRESFESQEC
jgi:hypothetical protein